MGPHVCPWWLGYFLLVPLRRLREHPQRQLGTWVREGMTVLEPGCGMGFFTLDLARMVGAGGRVIAVDLQDRMLSALRRRAAKRGLAERIDTRLAGGQGLGIADLAGRVDVCVAVHVVHEVPDQARFFGEVHAALAPGAPLVLIEPTGHVSAPAFAAEIAAARAAGFSVEQRPLPRGPRSALLRRAV